MNALTGAKWLNTPFAWLIRRELWENRYLWLVPLVLALAIFAMALGGWVFFGHAALHLDGDELRHMHDLSADQLAPFVSMGLAMVALPFLFVAQTLQFFYALDSLYGERRDRSILFYKSLPVSDTATVLSKLAVGSLAVLITAFLAALLTQILIAALTSVELFRYPVLVAALWSPRVWGALLLLMLYMVVALALWYLPLVAVWLLISSRASRAPMLWALLLLVALPTAEWIALRTHYAIGLIVQRFAFFAPIEPGEFGAALDRGTHGVPDAHAPLVNAVMAPVQFFSSPQLWAGLIAAAILVALTVWSRRRAEASS